jgi:hypothetical protein
VTIIEMSQTQLPTRDMQRQQAEGLIQQIQQQHQIMQQAQQAQLPAPGSDPSSSDSGTTPGVTDPSTTAIQQAQSQIQMLMGQLEKMKTQPTIEQVLKFLSDNRARSFTLDIETDSTILADETAEKQHRNEFMQVIGGVMGQLSTLISAEPKLATFCGEILKFATAPYRAGRTLDGAIDEMIEQLKAKGEQPRGDDPETAKGKIQLQLEQMKQQTAKEKNKQDLDVKQAEMAQKDKHKTWELNNQKEIERMKLRQNQESDFAKAQVQNQKAQTDREAHQAHMFEKEQDMALNKQKFDLAIGQAAMKSRDMAQRSNERQMAHQQKMTQPFGGGSRQ